MRKLMTLALGLSLFAGSALVAAPDARNRPRNDVRNEKRRDNRHDDRRGAHDRNDRRDGRR